MAHITTTGSSDVDSATSEIASALRHASPVDHGDQYFYDEAMRLRDAIMTGTRDLMAGTRNRTPCPECGGGYWQPYIGHAGDAASDEYIPHDGTCESAGGSTCPGGC